jgi:hypothetical protein
MPRRSFNIAIIDGALQIQEFPPAFGLLARYYLVSQKIFFRSSLMLNVYQLQENGIFS